ncbi:MAG TPA: glycosyltransferase [Candidatus Goldiibacteriota bacterium]|nr:glycosyltransferase [Candidatus Goldiibacteriota bacterium]HRQ44451.1 glycosyltransferase [Candidatus Goldiibacteriota bacterium]
MKVLVLSSQASNTGSTLRAFYIYKHLKKYADADYIAPPFKSMPFMLDFLFSLFYYFFMVLNRKYDAVIIVKPYPNTVLPALVLKAGGAKLIIDIDDMDYGYRAGFLSQVIKTLQDNMTEKADYLTSHNQTLIKLIEENHPRFKGKIYMLKQCVDLSLYKKTPSSLKISREIKSVYKGKKIMFYTAHLNIASYLDDILAAVSAVKEDYVLIVGGGGPMLDYYKKSAAKMGLSDKVIFTGQLKQEEIVPYILASDLCLVYYRNEPVNLHRASMKLREYLSLGANVAANAVGEIKDFKSVVRLSGSSVKNYSVMISDCLRKNKKTEVKAGAFIKSKFDWGRETRLFAIKLKEIINE